MSISVSDVINQALDLVEMENANGLTGFAVTSRVQNLFNQGLSHLHYTLADGDFDWWTETATIPITAGTATYTLPDGALYSAAPPFYKLKALYLVDAGKLYPLPKFQEQEIAGWDASGPRAAASLRMHYIPTYEPISHIVNPSFNILDGDGVQTGWTATTSGATATVVLTSDGYVALGGNVGETAIISQYIEDLVPGETYSIKVDIRGVSGTVTVDATGSTLSETITDSGRVSATFVPDGPSTTLRIGHDGTELTTANIEHVVLEGPWGSKYVDKHYPPGWEDYVACFIAHRLSVRDEQYERAMALAGERDAAIGRVIMHVSPRDIGRPDRVVDVTGRWLPTPIDYTNKNYAYRLRGNYLEIGQPHPLP